MGGRVQVKIVGDKTDFSCSRQPLARQPLASEVLARELLLLNHRMAAAVDLKVGGAVELRAAVIVLRGHCGQAQIHVNLCQRMSCVQNTLGSIDSNLRTHLREEFAL